MEFLYNNKNIKLQVVTSDTTFEEELIKKGIEIKECIEDIVIAKTINCRVICNQFSYISPNTNELVYVSQYVEQWDGAEEFGCYVAGSDELIEDVFALYDAMMDTLKK